jgi:short-subunit dehydrogenase
MITGASSGLGESLAHSFYKSGCHVILAARRQNELERVRSDLLAMHLVRIIPVVCDIEHDVLALLNFCNILNLLFLI